MEAENVRRGPWTAEEDALLANYVTAHGEGRWNAVARGAGLRRTGKSCRLRWLNYLRPDVRRGNITAEEQLLILQLHSHWGNRWSKIAQHLPGRTDNEIKNYWRTRVQKHARLLRCDPNSRRFQHLINSLWVPLLLQKIHHASASASDPAPAPAFAAAAEEAEEEEEEGKVSGSTTITTTPPNLGGGAPEGSSSTCPSASLLATVISDGEVGDPAESSGSRLLDYILWDGVDDFIDQWSSFDEDFWCIQSI